MTADTARIAAGLRHLAAVIEETGETLRVRRLDRRVVLPAVVHDAVCPRQVATPQDGDDGTALGCAFCGLLYERPVADSPAPEAQRAGPGLTVVADSSDTGARQETE